MTSKLLLISLLSLIIAACTSQAESANLPTQLRDHLSQTENSYENADTLWQQVLDGDAAVSCALTITVPEPFDLTVAQAEQHPESVIVRNHLNNAIAILTEIKLLWENECQQESPAVSLSTMRLAVGLLDDAEAEIRAADEAWVAWQS
ncbi:MAG: hypothetical protein L0154_15250 [Chloroflexi bacterium]|nr:hypothetical protein [Chloroflexota bacterium]